MADRPNIVLIHTDEQRHDTLACCGAERHSPAAHRLAREGVRFEYAFTPSAICSPARASLLADVRGRMMAEMCRSDDMIARWTPARINAALRASRPQGHHRLASRPPGQTALVEQVLDRCR